jgi:hypothetical protein
MVDTCAGATFDTVLFACPADCRAIETLACNDDACGADLLSSRIEFDATAGNEYLIRLASFGAETGSALVTIGCHEPCPCDWNNDDRLNSQDFFDFLSSFFDGVADYNHDDETNSQDFFDFLACFFAGCRG